MVGTLSSQILDIFTLRSHLLGFLELLVENITPTSFIFLQ